MDTELAGMKEAIARIDERTASILDNMEGQVRALSRHEDHDRADFKSVNDRITKVERKQNWMLGIGTAGIFVVTMIGGFLKGIFGV